MRSSITSVFVDDQDMALRFYTDLWGFVEKTEVPLGEHRWLTVVSPQDPAGGEFLLDLGGHRAVGPYMEALIAGGIPFASFAVDDVPKEVERLTSLGVTLTQETLQMGPVATPVLDDSSRTLLRITGHQR
jgi:catechol 2,3-dioxygenase-like lactoylglutathione lyase family enzyme